MVVPNLSVSAAARSQTKNLKRLVFPHKKRKSLSCLHFKMATALNATAKNGIASANTAALSINITFGHPLKNLHVCGPPSLPKMMCLLEIAKGHSEY